MKKKRRCSTLSSADRCQRQEAADWASDGRRTGLPCDPRRRTTSRRRRTELPCDPRDPRRRTTSRPSFGGLEESAGAGARACTGARADATRELEFPRESRASLSDSAWTTGRCNRPTDDGCTARPACDQARKDVCGLESLEAYLNGTGDAIGAVEAMLLARKSAARLGRGATVGARVDATAMDSLRR